MEKPRRRQTPRPRGSLGERHAAPPPRLCLRVASVGADRNGVTSCWCPWPYTQQRLHWVSAVPGVSRTLHEAWPTAETQ